MWVSNLWEGDKFERLYLPACLQQNLPVTKIVDELMEMRQSNEVEDYYYLDPKQLKRVEQTPKNRTTFQDVIVFIVGGGNYIEYQNLVDYVKVIISLYTYEWIHDIQSIKQYMFIYRYTSFIPGPMVQNSNSYCR